MMKGEIFSIGTELLSYNKIDTNSLWLSEKLETLGCSITSRHIIPDDKEIIKRCIRQALPYADLIITIGGLGPTQDDITRSAVCEALNKQLIFAKQIWQDIAKRYEERKRVISETAKAQAFIPEGAKYFLNKAGTAPGIWICEENKIIIMLPGPPD